MKRWIVRAAMVASLAVSTNVHAALPVIDGANLVQTTRTALQALKTEIYENTNIAYQYRMMANQLLQATGMDPAHLTEQLDAIKDEIGKFDLYGVTLNDLYGAVSDNADYLSKVRSMVKASGKPSGQWLEDQRTLLANGDKTAKNLFDLGTSVVKNVQTQAKRRQKIQKEMKLTGTAQAAAEATNEMLDVLANQNSDLLQMMSAKVQSDADKDQKALAIETESLDTARRLQAERDQQRQKILNLK
ncbi:MULTISPECIES: conjugal transfer protein TrbJ [Cupriavidus]|uniref:Putative TrbJ-like protein n=1 Tax=Cupriavidus taiwanensis TaxID=164546 RepID=A0A7Z7JHV8_9BURK|nr:MULTISPECIES: conjugal transfer protein TrbJ [Cupriavidus]NOV26621.1 conjugal transfer protein TrbJ [Cupriavidus necator]NSX13256.1 conjugal transfer protein TrbJ [Cupriavidus taiwanensis]SOZ18895.1 putative TrbJ-like protein [Cupriavidus taiwanensis]SOZ97012.1 putative TrbJ-like protein [Cupriavidus taiwanensis]SPC25913.1 putative TrbJ-like protein [Cupriavidus taiwanensis]